MKRLLVLFALASPLAAQSDPLRPLGIRVRVVTRDQTFTGLLAGAGGGDIRLRVDPTAPDRSIPASSISSFAVSRGRHSFVGRGALFGMLGVGGLTALAAGADCLSDPCRNPVGRIAVNALVLGGAGGALVGAVFRREHWERMPVPSSGDSTVAPGVVPMAALGVRVRITPTSGRPVTGELVRLDRDSLVVLIDRHERRGFGRRDVGEVEIARGARGRSAQGLLIGGLLGAGAGLAVGSKFESSGFIDEPEVLTAVAGGLLGGLLGATIGSAIRSERWEAIPLDALRIGLLVPPTGGLGISLSIPLRPGRL